ncbi:MAG: hypothetical protein JNM46_07835 [Anaerolineales bacterium]|nr:hypothetical protein [Anaerolineales bacterium]
MENKLSNPRMAQTALWGGIAFSAVFTFLIWLANPLLEKFVLIQAAEIRDYDWQLLNSTFAGQITAWGFYAIHQVILWALIYYAQTKVKKYSSGIHPVNVWALGVNAFFIILHLIQTHIWYDALAQDVSSFSSQGSVILMLCVILIIENKRRGMFFGYKASLSERIISFARKYHGYLFAWAVVYTFWFHPMVSTPGHLAGFFYMFLLMLQSSLFLTKIHVNKYWTVVQEITVIPHAFLIAIYQAPNIWQMFTFGFGAMFVVTQMHGLNLSRLTKWLISAAYVIAMLLVYNFDVAKGLAEAIRIPFIEYLVAFVIAGLVGLGLWIADRFRKPNQEALQVK